MSKFATRPPRHPGEWLQADMRRGGMTQSVLAKLCGISRFRVNEILNGKRSITVESAILIGAALNISAESLMSAQIRYDLYIYRARKSLGESIDLATAAVKRRGVKVHPRIAAMKTANLISR
jgi:addiction module HigA family antidote